MCATLQIELVDRQRLDPAELDLELAGSVGVIAPPDDRVAAGDEVADLGPMVGLMRLAGGYLRLSSWSGAWRPSKRTAQR